MALDIDREIFEPASPAIGRDLAKRAALAHARRELATAKTDYVDALALLSPKGSRTAEAQLGYARLFLQSNDLGAAESVASEALRIRETDLPEGHSLIGEVRTVLREIERQRSAQNARL